MQTTTSKGRYRVTRHADGKLTVHDVPIFAECYKQPRPTLDGSPPKFDGHFSAEWIKTAVKNAMQRHSEGYFGPVHVLHHMETATGDAAKRAGTFEVTGTSVIRYEGKPRLAVMADITITDETAQFDVMEERVPFRSIEALHPGTKPEFDSLALLDTKVPFLRLPNMTIGAVTDDRENEKGESIAWGAVPGGTFSEPMEMGTLEGGGPMVAFATQGSRTAFLFHEEPMAEKTLASMIDKAIDALVDDDASRGDVIAKVASAAGIEPGTLNEIINGDIEKPPDSRLKSIAAALNVSAQSLITARGALDDSKEEKNKMSKEKFGAGVTTPGHIATATKVPASALAPGGPFIFNDDEKKPDDKEGLDDHGGGGTDIKGLLKAVAAGDLPFKDMMALSEALNTAMASTGPQAAPEDAPAPAAVPGGAAMTADDGTLMTQFTALSARSVAQDTRIAQLEQSNNCERHVGKAIKRLESRGILNLEARLTEFFNATAAAGVEPFELFVDTLAKLNGPMPEGDNRPDTAVTMTDQPAEVMAFADQGAEVVEMAAGHARQHAWLKRTTSMTVSLKDYIQDRFDKDKAQADSQIA